MYSVGSLCRATTCKIDSTGEIRSPRRIADTLSSLQGEMLTKGDVLMAKIIICLVAMAIPRLTEIFAWRQYTLFAIYNRWFKEESIVIVTLPINSRILRIKEIHLQYVTKVTYVIKVSTFNYKYLLQKVSIGWYCIKYSLSFLKISMVFNSYEKIILQEILFL